MYISFSRDSGWESRIRLAHTYRFAETPDFTREADHIRSAENPLHPEGFDNISLLTAETYSAGVTATLRCGFEGLGCPELLLVFDPETDANGKLRYGACFEIVVYENGINVWRHYREDGKCFWHQRLGVEYPVAENEIHTLRVVVQEDLLEITLDGQKNLLRTEDIPEKFHLGLTACEGIARLYDFEIV